MADNNNTFSSSLGANHYNNIHPLDFGKLLHGCGHYRRRCKIRAPCCNQIFFCRHCHKDSMGAFHEIVRQDIKQVICAICSTEQEVAQICTNCGVKMGEYFCGICKFYDDDISKKQFHCDDCGICRVGGGANFFHCQKCGACWDIQSCDTHVCVENAMKDHCPICYEYLFDCMKSTAIMNCGHVMHVDCCTEMINQNVYRCPICTKSFADLVTPWRLFFKESEATPEEYRYETDLELKSVPSLQVESTDCGYIHQSMASSSSNSPQASSSRSWKYDVFLSFRGEDTRKTFVDHLYSALVQKLIRVYKDDEALPRGDSIAPSLFKAIEVSRIIVIVFSKNYADSSWCLDELAYIMKCRDEIGLIVMPIFYDMDPSQVRKLEGNFGEAYAKQEAKNVTKAELWRKSIFDASNIAGWEPKHIANGHETKVIKEIANKIQDRLFPLYSDVDEELVGMRERLQDLISQLEIDTGGVHMVGIWGIGGSGKTTLAFSVYTEISHHFEGHCFIANIREKSKHGLEILQQKLLSTLLKRDVEVQSVQQGNRIIKSRLCNSKLLVILDDVDYLDQLEALAGSPKWFGSGSRIIITTRDEHLLRTHRVDHVSSVKLLSDEEATLLFYKHAYNETEPLIDYEKLSSRVVSYAAGLPLALKVLGSFLFDADKEEWISTLAKLEDIPNIEVMDILRISYDGLETLQKELFLDIACFFRLKSIDDAMEILDACGFHPVIGIKVLRQKALITTTDGKFDMHDLVQEMAQYIVRGEHPKNPDKHSRVWKNEEISNMCYGDSTVENDKIEAMRYYGHSSRFFEFISNMKKLRWLSVVMYLDDRDKHTEGPSFLSNELRYLYWERYPASPFPDRFQPMKLVVLKLHYSLQKALWNGCKCLPHLKVLELCFMSNLLGTPDFNGLPYLQKLKIFHCDKLEEIHPSHGNHTSLQYVSVKFCEKLRMFPMNVQMKNLKILELPKIKSNPSGECYTQPETVVHQFTRKMNLSSLQKLDLSGWGLKDGEIPSGIGELSHLEELDLSRNDFSLLGFSLSQLTRLKILILSECKLLVELPELPSSIAILEADYCDSLTTIGNNGHTSFKCLCEVSLLRKSRGIVNDARRIVESMLQGMGIESLYMVICERLIKTAKVLPIVIMNKCTMQLPENWCNDFCGFIMCVFTKSSTPLRYTIRMEKAKKDMMIFCPRHDLPFKKSIGRGRTRVGFVSFDSLRHTSWWEEIHNTRFVSFEDALQHKEFGIALVPKKSRIAPTETSTDFHAFPRLNILDDSTSTLTIEIGFRSNDKSGKYVSDTIIKPKSI